MSEPTASPEPTVSAVQMPWDWRMLDFAVRQTSAPPKPLPYVVRLCLGAGALEGLLLGLIQGGIGTVILSVIWGAIVGFACGMIVWNVRQRVSIVVLTALAGMLINAGGRWLIALCVPALAQLPFWPFAEWIFLLVLGAIPFAILMIVLLYREIRAALGGLVPGAYVGAVCSTVFFVYLAAVGIGDWWALPLFGLLGAILGLVNGPLFGALFGMLVGALLNVNRRTILPTYLGFASAIALGLAGWSTGRDIAGDDGAFVGGWLGVSWGAVAGIAFGTLLTPPSWRKLLLNNYTDLLSLKVFDMSDGRRLADLTDKPYPQELFLLILGQIGFRTRKLYLEPVEEEYRAAFECPDPAVEPHPPMSFVTGLMVIAALKELAGLEPAQNNDSLRRREGDIQVIVSSSRVDLHMVFEPASRGERVTITIRSDPGAADAAARVRDRFLFLLKARRWLLWKSLRPSPRSLREIA